MLRGIYKDELIDELGRATWRSLWRHNAIADSCNRLLAALMKREDGIEGILYWAIGQGDSDWDGAPQEASSATSQLVNEVARQELTSEQLAYLDDEGSPSETPTDRLEITAEFSLGELGAESPLPLREFGLFGGDATSEADSGLLVDYVIHPRIDLSEGFTLRRTLRLSFASGIPTDGIPAPDGEPTPLGFGASLPVIAIDGVGEEYGGQLAANGVATIGDLVLIDPLESFDEIPAVRVREFRAKARLVLGLRVDLASFEALSERDVSGVLRASPSSLASDAGGIVTSEDAVRLQEQLAVLQIALDDAQLQQVTLGALMEV